jgi:ABC-2 type transport system permease protein
MRGGRLSTLAAALVVARRDFTAILFGRSFIFFLLAPFFPVVVALAAGGIGQQVRQSAPPAQLGLIMAPADAAALVAAREQLAPRIGWTVPVITPLGEGQTDPRAALGQGNLAAVLSGTLDNPRLTGTADRIAQWQGPVALLAATARSGVAPAYPEVATDIVVTTSAGKRENRTLTAQGGQTMLFLLTMLLAGMVLSNLVEEKGNKVIEVLAAAIPMDAVFLGKLFAMLAVSFVAIAVWTAVGLSLIAFYPDLPQITAPALGWPLFLILGVVYFATAYLLLGSLFLAIGSLATTVRDVQTLSFPVTMLQLMVFLFATYAMSQQGSAVELAGIAFPWSSPFVMLARAANDPGIWPHLAAIAWQLLWVAVIIRLGARMFKVRVMKSGPAGTSAWRSLLARIGGAPSRAARR